MIGYGFQTSRVLPNCALHWNPIRWRMWIPSHHSTPICMYNTTRCTTRQTRLDLKCSCFLQHSFFPTQHGKQLKTWCVHVDNVIIHMDIDNHIHWHPASTHLSRLLKPQLPFCDVHTRATRTLHNITGEWKSCSIRGCSNFTWMRHRFPAAQSCCFLKGVSR